MLHNNYIAQSLTYAIMRQWLNLIVTSSQRSCNIPPNLFPHSNKANGKVTGAGQVNEVAFNTRQHIRSTSTVAKSRRAAAEDLTIPIKNKAPCATISYGFMTHGNVKSTNPAVLEAQKSINYYLQKHYHKSEVTDEVVNMFAYGRISKLYQ